MNIIQHVLLNSVLIISFIFVTIVSSFGQYTEVTEQRIILRVEDTLQQEVDVIQIKADVLGEGSILVYNGLGDNTSISGGSLSMRECNGSASLGMAAHLTRPGFYIQDTLNFDNDLVGLLLDNKSGILELSSLEYYQNVYLHASIPGFGSGLIVVDDTTRINISTIDDHNSIDLSATSTQQTLKFISNEKERITLISNIGTSGIVVRDEQAKNVAQLASTDGIGSLLLSYDTTENVRLNAHHPTAGTVMDLNDDKVRLSLRSLDNNHKIEATLIDEEPKILIKSQGPNSSGIVFNYDSIDIIKIQNEFGYPNITLIDEFNNNKVFLGQEPASEAGKLSLYGESGNKLSELNSNIDNSGLAEFYGLNGSLNVRTTSLLGFPNNGYFGIHDDLGTRRISAYATSQRVGQIWVDGANNSNNVLLAEVIGQTSRGYIHVANNFGDGRAGAYINNADKGVVWSDEFVLNNASNMPVAGLKFTGGNSEVYAHTFTGTVKNFRIDHPNKEGKEIVYACVEGPEVAAYARGSANLINGVCTVTLPEHFSAIVDQEGITVQLTPNSADSRGMAVISKTPFEFVVKELMNGTGNYAFDWEVKARRSGYADYQVVRDKKDVQSLDGVIRSDENTENIAGQGQEQ